MKGRQGTVAVAVAVAVAAMIALAGCASLPSEAPVAADAPPIVSGKLGVSVDGAPERSFSAGFELQGDTLTGRLALVNPLGLRMGEARWQPERAELLTADGLRRYDSVDQLAQDLVGEPLPLQALPSWLAGRPWAGAEFTPLPAPDSGFSQLQWRVDTTLSREGRYVAVRTSPAPTITVRVRVIAP